MTATSPASIGGKRSICLDLASAQGKAKLGELVADSHALLVNMKPSVIRRLGLTYENLRRYNEKIVCVAMTGFGLNGETTRPSTTSSRLPPEWPR